MAWHAWAVMVMSVFVPELTIATLLPTVAFSVLAVVLVYAAVLRGDVWMKRWFVLHVATLMPFVFVTAMASALPSDVALAWFRITAALLVVAAVAAINYQLALLRPIGANQSVRAWVLLALALVLAAYIASGEGLVATVKRVGLGVWFPVAGQGAWPVLLAIIAITLLGFPPLVRAARHMPDANLRRQLRRTLLANAITMGGLHDFLVAWGVTRFPLAWLLVTAGSALALRALLRFDLLRARGVDSRLPNVATQWIFTIVVAWMLLALLKDASGWWVEALCVGFAYGAVRMFVAAFAQLMRGGRSQLSATDALINHHRERAGQLVAARHIVTLTEDVVMAGAGVRPEIWLASADDWGWTTAEGILVPSQALPDPVLISWLVEQGVVVVDDNFEMPDDLAQAWAALQRGASHLVLVADGPDLVGMMRLTVARRTRHVRPFLEQVAQSMAHAITTARLASEVREYAVHAQDLELASALQASYVPAATVHSVGGFQICGGWQPASAVGGDVWVIHELNRECALLVVGDVSGHGVAPALVTAAVTGACRAKAQAWSAASGVGFLTELARELDRVVRNAGAGQMHMTCFMAVLACDEITYLNVGHTSPYVQWRSVRGVEMAALVSRHNPLGMGELGALAPVTRELPGGALLVVYTDGLTDTPNSQGEAYGERRLQRQIRALETRSVREALRSISAAIQAHRGEAALVDDQMLVVVRCASSEVSGAIPRAAT